MVNFISFDPQMKRVLFFAFLCFLLLGFHDRASAGMQKVYTQQEKLTNNCQNSTLTEKNNLHSDKVYFICTDIEDEDEDPNEFSTRKYKLLTRLSTLFHTVSLQELSGFQSPDSSARLRGIYIIQRTLRI